MMRSKYIHRTCSSQIMFTEPWAHDGRKTPIPNCQVPSTQHGSFDGLHYYTWPGLPLVIPDPMSKPLKFHHHLSQAENTFSEELMKTGTPASWYFIQTKQALDTKVSSVQQPTFSSFSCLLDSLLSSVTPYPQKSKDPCISRYSVLLRNMLNSGGLEIRPAFTAALQFVACWAERSFGTKNRWESFWSLAVNPEH